MAFKKIEPKTFKSEMSKSDNTKHYPSFSINLDYAPELKDAAVDSDVEITIKGKLKGVNTIYGNEAQIDMREIDVIKPAAKKKINRYQNKD